MDEVRLTERAAFDLQAIFEFGYARFGLRQALLYQSRLKHAFVLLAAQPQMGRSARPKSIMRRHEHGRHVIFYGPVETGVLILTIRDNRSVREPPQTD